MEFYNTKKIAIKGGYFQIATGDHEQYGKSLAISILGKKQQDNKWIPDYDNRKTILCSFNQASKIAAHLRLISLAIIFQVTHDIESAIKIGKSQVTLKESGNGITSEFTISNGDSKSIELSFEVANIIADLITIRLTDLDVQDEEVPEESEEEIENKERKRLFEAIIEKSLFLNTDAVQDMLERGRKEHTKKSDIEILKMIGKPFGVC